MSRSVNFLLIAAISAVVFLGCKKERSFRGANPGDEIVFGGTAGSASGFRSSKTKGGDGDSSASGVLAGTDLDSCVMNTCSSYVRDDSDADETFFFDWEDFEGGDALGSGSAGNEIHDASSVVNTCKGLSGSAGSESLSGVESGVSCGGGISEAYSEDRANGSSSFGCSDAGNGLFEVSDSDVQTKTDYSGHKENVGSKTYERIDWVAGDKVRIFGDNVLTLYGAPSEMVYKVTSPSIKPGNARRSFASLEKESASTQGLHWGSGNADFYAFYPGNSPAKVSASNTPSNFDVTVKLPKEQNIFTKTTSGNHTEVRPDMELAAMLAISRDVPPASSVQLDFLPLVTTFRITLSNSLGEDITIKKVSLVSNTSSEPMSGNYKVSYTKVGGSTLSSHSVLAAHFATGSFSKEVSVNLGSVPGGEVFLPKKNGGIVSSMSVTLFALPVNHSQVRLSVKLEQGGRLETHTLDLAQNSPGGWLTFDAYKKYDIRVGAGKDWNVELNAEDKIFPYTGGTETINITSRKTYYSQSVPLPWKVEGYCTTGPDGAFTDTKPTWLTLFKIGGGSLTVLTSSSGLNVSVFPKMSISNNVRTMALRAKSEVGSQSDPIDLSKVPLDASPLFSIEDGTTASTYAGNPMNTANCYVVTRPGWYKIPVVYGNAIKGTTSEKERPNTAAYTSSNSESYVLHNFIRHDGQAITKPWIKENINLNSGVAELSWQDRLKLVQNIALQSDKKYIVFYIDKERIHEGNAVIALKESATGDIVWSWHIWVTASNMKTINVKNNKAKAPTSKPGQDNFNFLSENLGACDDSGESVLYYGSKVWVKVSNGMKTEVINITRTGASLAPKYNSPYYQWGRKDPMLPFDGTASNRNKVWYDKGSASNNNLPTSSWLSNGSIPQANAVIANTIKHPQKFNKSECMDKLYYNLWDTKCKGSGSFNDVTTAIFEAATKSVYDPCPPGFCLPPDGAFTGFTRLGNTSYLSYEWNVSGSFDKGWHFRTVLKDESGGETIFFPALGCRLYNDGVLYNVGSDCYYWSSLPCGVNFGCDMKYELGYVSPLSFSNRSIGFVVRPVRE